MLIAFHTSLVFGQVDDAPNSRHYKTSRFDGVVFTENYISFYQGQKFTPENEDIDRVENALRNDLETVNSQRINQTGRNPIIHQNLSKYRRQYFGYVDQNGDRIIHVNCFWKEKGRFDNWLDERVTVLDGGSHYWSVKFNLTTGKLFDLQVNGSA